MARTANYFSHDADARNDSRILRLRMRYGAEGYGVYFMILERLRVESEYMSIKDYNMIAFDLRVDASLVKSVVEDFGLFAFANAADERGECFYSESFCRRMDMVDTVKEARSAAARKRWNGDSAKTVAPSDANAMQMHTSSDANAMQMHTKKDAIKINKKKINKSKDEEEVKEEISPSSSSSPEFKKLSLNFKIWDNADLLSGDEEWQTAVSEHFGIARALMAPLIESFAGYCRGKGKQHENEADARGHFFYWLDTKQGKAAATKLLRAQTQSSGLQPGCNLSPGSAPKPLRDPAATKPADFIRRKGYNPERVTMAMLSQPGWTEKHPPTDPEYGLGNNER